MVAIAAIALAIRGGQWIGEMKQRRAVALMAAANENGRMIEFEYDGLLESSIEDRIKFKGMSRVEAEACVRKEMEEIAGKVRIYQRAAARPWLPLPPEIANLKVAEPDPFPSHCGYILNEIRRQSAGRKMEGGSAHPP